VKSVLKPIVAYLKLVMVVPLGQSFPMPMAMKFLLTTKPLFLKKKVAPLLFTTGAKNTINGIRNQTLSLKQKAGRIT
jgi:hypothetical protein